MKKDLYEPLIANVPGFPKPGIIFKDITPVLEDANALHALMDDLAEEASKFEFDKIICADARGFIFGPTLAYKLNKGIVLSRKPNKLPRPGITYTYDLEYGSETMVISEGSVKPGEKFLLVDDLLATGGSGRAMIEMVKQCGGEVVGALFFIELTFFKAREKFMKQYGVPTVSLVTSEDE